jgi:hypothetical protein
MNYKHLVYFLILFGILLITINLVGMYKKCPTEKILYRYIPRTFEEEQNSPIPVTELFADLFNQPDMWVAAFGLTRRTRGDINKYFITQGVNPNP